MSTANKSSSTASTPAPSLNGDLILAWLSRRRIAISLLGFTALVVYNLVIEQTQVNNPLAVWHWNCAAGMLLVLSGLAIRSWSAGTLHKSHELSMVGPYAFVRNPLYVGSFLMMYGFAVLMTDWLSVLFIAGPMSLVYWFQVQFEEKNLKGWFPADWQIYVKETPRFIPYKFSSKWRGNWSAAMWSKNREYQAILGATIGILGLVVLSWMGN